MPIVTKFNPFTRKLDYIEQDVASVASASAYNQNPIEIDADGVMWYWSGGHRYRLSATLSDPVTSYQPIPPFLWISTT